MDVNVSKESVYTGNCIKGSNPFLSARRDTGVNLKLAPVFVYQNIYALELPEFKVGRGKNWKYNLCKNFLTRI